MEATLPHSSKVWRRWKPGLRLKLRRVYAGKQWVKNHSKQRLEKAWQNAQLWSLAVEMVSSEWSMDAELKPHSHHMDDPSLMALSDILSAEVTSGARCTMPWEGSAGGHCCLSLICGPPHGSWVLQGCCDRSAALAVAASNPALVWHHLSAINHSSLTHGV